MSPFEFEMAAVPFEELQEVEVEGPQKKVKKTTKNMFFQHNFNSRGRGTFFVSDS